MASKRGKSACSNPVYGIPQLNCASGRRRSIWFSNRERYNSSAQIRSAAGRRVRMGGNSQKPDLSVTKTTPVRPVKRCGDWVLRVFQRKSITPSATTEGSGPAICTAVVCAPVPNGGELPSYFQLHLSAGDYSGLGTHPLHAQLAVLNVLDCSLPSCAMAVASTRSRRNGHQTVAPTSACSRTSDGGRRNSRMDLVIRSLLLLDSLSSFLPLPSTRRKPFTNSVMHRTRPCLEPCVQRPQR